MYQDVLFSKTKFKNIKFGPRQVGGNQTTPAIANFNEQFNFLHETVVQIFRKFQ